MIEYCLTADVQPASPMVNRIDLKGEVTSFSSSKLIDAYTRAVQGGRAKVILNFTGVTYLNSSGIGILISLLIRAEQKGVKIVGYGLREHYRKIFEITRLDQAMPIYDSEETALGSVEPFGLGERRE